MFFLTCFFASIIGVICGIGRVTGGICGHSLNKKLSEHTVNILFILLLLVIILINIYNIYRFTR